MRIRQRNINRSISICNHSHAFGGGLESRGFALDKSFATRFAFGDYFIGFPVYCHFAW